MNVAGRVGWEEVQRESLAQASRDLWLSLGPGWQGNLQRCKGSLGVGLAASKLLWELRAGILQQAIPLCLSFCLSVLNSPSALIHSHIQFPALSIHQSPQFVSADFIVGLTITLQPSQAAAEPPPPAAPPAPRSADRGPGRAACRSLLHRPAKTLILNLIPIVLLFTFPTEGNARETDTEERGKPRGGGRCR